MDVAEFFARHAVPAWAAVPVDRIRAPAGRHPRDLLRSSKSLVVFGKPTGVEIFSFPARRKSRELYGLAREVDQVAQELAAGLISEGYRSIHIPAFIPARIIDGRLKGTLSLKHCAAEAGLGELGLNTLLIHPKHGNRLVLAAVATDSELDQSPAHSSRALCTGCRRCIDACPVHAFGPTGVDQRSCLNMSRAVPALLRPVLYRAMESTVTAPLMESIVNALSGSVTMSCSACLSACPYFRHAARDEERRPEGEVR
jgi:epoxyqueuosine reductase